MAPIIERGAEDGDRERAAVVLPKVEGAENGGEGEKGGAEQLLRKLRLRCGRCCAVPCVRCLVLGALCYDRAVGL